MTNERKLRTCSNAGQTKQVRAKDKDNAIFLRSKNGQHVEEGKKTAPTTKHGCNMESNEDNTKFKIRRKEVGDALKLQKRRGDSGRNKRRRGEDSK